MAQTSTAYQHGQGDKIGVLLAPNYFIPEVLRFRLREQRRFQDTPWSFFLWAFGLWLFRILACGYYVRVLDGGCFGFWSTVALTFGLRLLRLSAFVMSVVVSDFGLRLSRVLVCGCFSWFLWLLVCD